MLITPHAKDRIYRRLGGLVTEEEVHSKIKGRTFKVGETWVRIKRFPEYKSLPECYGDVIYAIVKRSSRREMGAVATVELRGGEQRIKGDYFIP